MNIALNFVNGFVEFALEFLKIFPLMFLVFKFNVKSAKMIFAGAVFAIVLMTAAAFGSIEAVYAYIAVGFTAFILKGKNHILSALTAYFAICILDMLNAVIWSLIGKCSYEMLAENRGTSLAINAVSLAAVILVCIISFASRRKSDFDLKKISPVYFLLIIFGELSMLGFITAFQLGSRAIDGTENFMSVVLTGGSIVFLIISFFLMINLVSKKHYKELSEINEKIIEERERYYLSLLKKDEETRKFRHDINHHLNCMRILFDNERYDELHDYFNKIGAKIEELRPEIQTGNDMLSAILSDMAECYPTVTLCIDGKTPNSLSLSNADICTIFYNLFDNAFAAAEKTQEKKVTVSLKVLNDSLYVAVVNTVSHKVKIVDNTLVTDKQDKTKHGYGAANARECAAQNGGALTFDCTDTHFTAELIIPQAAVYH